MPLLVARRPRFASALVLLVAAAVGCGDSGEAVSRSEPLSRDEAYAAIAEILSRYAKVEGHTHNFPLRERCLRALSGRPDVQQMAEIGFNAGHSTVTLLDGRPNKTLVSFDLCRKPYYEATSSLLMENYPGQLEIICGDSTQTLPELIEREPPPRFDFIHIDGGHEGEVPRLDIQNSLQLSHPGTFILVDDCNEVQSSKRDGWIAPDVKRAWRQAVDDGLIAPVYFATCNIGNCLGKPKPAAAAAP